MKRILTILLAAILVLSLAACGSAENSSSPASPETSVQADTSASGENSDLSGQTVNMVIWGSDERKASYDELFDEFTKETGIKVNITLVELESIITKTSAQIAAGDSYDLVWMSEAMIPQMMNNGLLEDVSAIKDDPDYDYSDISPSVQSNYEGSNGEVYAVSFTSSPRVWFYNKDLVAEAGLEDPLELAENGEWTYDKLFEYSKAISALNDQTYGFSI